MNKWLFALLVFTLQLPAALAICDLPPAPPPPAPEPPAPPPIDKIDPPSTPDDPVPPITPGDNPRPKAPGANPRGNATRTRPSAANYSGSWEIWWELNREHLLGLRQTLKRNEPISGGGTAPDVRIAARARVRDALASLPGWSLANDKLHREFRFADFVRAMGFMTQVALVAEAMDHHPEWFNVYGRVVVDLTTHSAKGITALDVTLAERMDELAG